MAYYNKIKEKIQAETPLPSELSWEDMQAGIMGRMQPVEKDKKRRYLFLIPFFIVGLGVAFYLFSHQNQKDIDTKNKDNKMAATTPKSIHKLSLDTAPISSKLINQDSLSKPASTEPKANPTPIQAFKGNNEIKSSVAGTGNEGTKSTTLNNKNATVSTESKMIAGRASNSLIYQNTTAQSFTVPEQSAGLAQERGKMDLPKDIQGLHTNTTYPIVEGVTMPSNDDAKDMTVTDYIQSENIVPIEYLPFEGFSALYTNTISNLSPSRLALIRPALCGMQSNVGLLDFYISSGVTMWNLNTTIVSMDNMHFQYDLQESALPSFDISGRLDVGMGKSFYVSTGLNVNKLYSVFEFYGDKSTNKQVTNVLTNIQYDILSGVRTNIFGDTIVHVNEKRSLRQRNSITNIAIPLLLGYQKEVNKWQYKMAIGPIISIKSTFNGKYLLDDTVETFAGNAPHLNTSMGIGMTGEASIRYHLKPSLFVGMGAAYTTYGKEMSAWSSTSLQPSLFGIQAMVGYKL